MTKNGFFVYASKQIFLETIQIGGTFWERAVENRADGRLTEKGTIRPEKKEELKASLVLVGQPLKVSGFLKGEVGIHMRDSTNQDGNKKHKFPLANFSWRVYFC